MGIMNQHIIHCVATFTDRNGFQFKTIQHKTFVTFFSENHLFAVAKEDGTVCTIFLINDTLMNAVIENYTVYQHFRDRSTFMACRSSQYFSCILQIHIDHPGKEVSACSQSQFSRDKRVFHCSVRRTFRNEATFGSRGVLSFGQTINFIVEKNYVQVDITTYGMDKMVTTDSQTVAVAGDQPDTQVGTGSLHTCCYCSTTSVDGMETVCIHIIR